MAITDKTTGPWGLDQVYNKINQGSIWNYQNGTLWAWGSGGDGGLAQNNTTTLSSPVQVGTDTTWSIPENGLSVSTAGAGFVNIKGDGTLWAVGDNSYGNLGQNQPDNSHYSSPVQIGSDTDWKFLANPTNTMGNGSTFAIKTNGELWVWGYGGDGKLGLNSQTQYSSPVQLPGTTWNNIASASSVAGGVKTDGTLWLWGRNPYGELAQNDRTYRSSPTQVPGTDWRTIYTGHYGLAAIKTDGTLWSWGYNYFGALGHNESWPGGIKARSSPTQIPGTTWKQYNAGNACSFGLKTDGTLYAWGYNNNGALGVLDHHDDGHNYSSPTQIPGTTWSWVTAQCNGHGGYALKTDGTMWSWGRNNMGQLGQNNKTDRSSPIQIPGTWSGVVGSSSAAIAFKNA